MWPCPSKRMSIGAHYGWSYCHERIFKIVCHLWYGFIGERNLNLRSFDGQLIHLFQRHGPKFAILGSYITYYYHSRKCTLSIVIMILIINCQQTEFEPLTLQIGSSTREHTAFTSKYILSELDEQKPCLHIVFY